MSERNPQTKVEAEAYIEQVNSLYHDSFSCKYGHFDCATHEGGPCSDELHGQFNLDAEDES